MTFAWSRSARRGSLNLIDSRINASPSVPPVDSCGLRWNPFFVTILKLENGECRSAGLRGARQILW